MRILILEDNKLDAELAVRELKRSGLDVEFLIVQTKIEFLKALNDFEPEVILSDFSMPQFSGLDALRITRKWRAEMPFVLCTGSLTEEVAVECMKEGASDYILKSSLKRLPSALVNVLQKSKSRTAEINATNALRQSEYKLRTLITSMSEGLLEVDLNDRVEFVNDRMCELVGYSREELIGTKWARLLFEEDPQFVENLNKRRDKGISDRYETRLKRKSGDAIWAMVGGVPLKNSDGTATGSLGVFTDITEKKRAEQQLLHDAFHDGLTGLPNRSLFMEHLAMSVARGPREESSTYAVLFIDLDRFKVVNDSLGHSEGNNLLKLVAQRLVSLMRPGDLIARMGGDEFTVLISGLHEESEALRLVERIQQGLQEPFLLCGREIFISASIGIAFNDPAYQQADDMLRDADVAMYRAKSRGAGQYQIFDQSMHEHALAQLQLETEMRHALQRDEFCLHYQPIVNLDTGLLMGFESLVRWSHPTRGLVPPFEFISSAEDSGLIVPLGKWVLEESCRQMSEWHNAHPHAAFLTISVNLSSKQFLQEDLAEQITRILEYTRLPPGSLKLEITESHLMENSEKAAAMMYKLRSLGVGISLDDFGTGYSSLSYLHTLPVDYLKIDRSFVMGMAEGSRHGEVVSTIIKLAQNLKLQTIAEGIETREQLRRLQELGCEYGQGYYFARPLDRQAAFEFMMGDVKDARETVNDVELNLSSVG